MIFAKTDEAARSLAAGSQPANDIAEAIVGSLYADMQRAVLVCIEEQSYGVSARLKTMLSQSAPGRVADLERHARNLAISVVVQCRANAEAAARKP